MPVTVAALYMYYLVAVLINLYVVDGFFAVIVVVVVVLWLLCRTLFPPQKNRCNPAEMGQMSFYVVTF